MKITTTRAVQNPQQPQRRGVVVSNQLKRERVMLDRDGNVIVPNTKIVITKAEDL